MAGVVFRELGRTASISIMGGIALGRLYVVDLARKAPVVQPESLSTKQMRTKQICPSFRLVPA